MQREVKTTNTACPYCGVGCGVKATVDGDGAVSVAGDTAHPANYGRLCSKGSALAETISLEGRLLTPRVDGAEASWDHAIDRVASAFSKAVEEHGPDSVAFYVSGQLLTEDYYVANKLIKGYLGTANIDTNSRLCMASSVAGHNRAFGSDTVPGSYEDLEQADLIVLVGSNLAWCHPVLFQRIEAAKRERPNLKVINIDPRITATTDLADDHLQIAPGSDVALFNGLLRAIDAEGAVEDAYVKAYVSGFDDAVEASREATYDHVAEKTGLSPVELARFYATWIENERVVTVYSQGVNQSTAGVDKVNAILNCHLATGRIGREGMGPFSVTGQPNAMGGREVGGLANMLACHLSVDNEAHRDAVQGFWDAPVMAAKQGLKAVDLFKACKDGKIKALWIMSTNPAVSMPDAGAVREAIAATPFVAVSDILVDTDTTRLADVLLPAAGWGEKSGTVTNSERVISRQRPFLPMPGETRPDWKIICDVAAAMGWGEAFAFESAADVFREHAALSKIAGDFGRDFDISALAEITDAEFDALTPVQWPVTKSRTGGRFFSEGGFFTGDKRGKMIPLAYRPPATSVSEKRPLRLNTGRVRDHWHTMTRTARSTRLNRHLAEPFVEVHPDDAARYGVSAASLAVVSSGVAECILRVLVTDRTPAGTIFAPFHWTSEWSGAALVDDLVEPHIDAMSGQPESKASPVSIKAFKAEWYGFVLSRKELLPKTDYWARAKTDGGWQAELAGMTRPLSWEGFARDLLDISDDMAAVAEDSARGSVRIVFSQGGAPTGLFFASKEPVAVARAHIRALWSEEENGDQLLPGRPGGDRPDPGATVCSCFNIGMNTILHAIEEHGLNDVAAIGDAIQAGTNCGSCRPELRQLLTLAEEKKAASERIAAE